MQLILLMDQRAQYKVLSLKRKKFKIEFESLKISDQFHIKFIRHILIDIQIIGMAQFIMDKYIRW